VVIAYLHAVPCASCNQRHGLYLDASTGFVRGDDYEYVCPGTGQRARHQPGAPHHWVRNPPTGAVKARRVRP
jgi:hypothetical protein